MIEIQKFTKKVKKFFVLDDVPTIPRSLNDTPAGNYLSFFREQHRLISRLYTGLGIFGISTASLICLFIFWVVGQNSISFLDYFMPLTLLAIFVYFTAKSFIALRGHISGSLKIFQKASGLFEEHFRLVSEQQKLYSSLRHQIRKAEEVWNLNNCHQCGVSVDHYSSVCENCGAEIIPLLPN